MKFMLFVVQSRCSQELGLLEQGRKWVATATMVSSDTKTKVRRSLICKAHG